MPLAMCGHGKTGERARGALWGQALAVSVCLWTGRVAPLGEPWVPKLSRRGRTRSRPFLLSFDPEAVLRWPGSSGRPWRAGSAGGAPSGRKSSGSRPQELRRSAGAAAVAPRRSTPAPRRASPASRNPWMSLSRSWYQGAASSSRATCQARARTPGTAPSGHGAPGERLLRVAPPRRQRGPPAPSAARPNPTARHEAHPRAATACRPGRPLGVLGEGLPQALEPEEPAERRRHVEGRRRRPR